MPKLIKTGVDHVYKDPAQNIFINTNDKEYQKIINNRKQHKNLKSIENDIDSLKNEFTEIKALLIQLCENQQNGKN